MNNSMIVSVLSLVCLSLGQQTAVRAGDGCEPFLVTTTVFVAPTENPGEFSLLGAGEGTLGEVTQFGLIQFRLVGGTIHFRSRTVISTPGGDLYTAEAGNVTEEGTVGSYRILGGTGDWEGASGNGTFRVEANDDGTQSATYTGALCR